VSDESGLFINRELSWLEFNARVLDQARDPGIPLLERVKFLGIFGSNLDEFFMVRVSGLHEQLEAEVVPATADGLAVREQLARIRARVTELVGSAVALFRDDIVPALEKACIRIVSWDELSRAQTEWARRYFRRSVFPVLTPLGVDPGHPFPFMSNLSVSLAVEARSPETGEIRFVRIKVPEGMARFVRVGPGGAEPCGDFIPLEELIAGNLGDLIPGMEILGCYAFRVTRDMDLDILEDEAQDLLKLVDRRVRERRLGAAVRLEVSPALPARIRAMLVEKLEIDDDDVYAYDGLLGLAGLAALAQIPVPELHDPPLVPAVVDWGEAGPFAAIAAGDLFLRHPRDSFDSVLDLLRTAVDDPAVLAIKMTLYRTSKKSETVPALIRAAENGKQVAVALELQARFDEANNISWARALDRAGVHVFFGSAALKTHAKILLIIRREGAELRRYVHVASGNYNAVTARLYTDLALITAAEDFGDDACDLFNMLSGFSRPAGFRRFVVAPMTLRPTLLGKIGEQTARARAGRPARIFAKLNALVDGEIIRALYAASQAGVDVDLVVRGICCLRPGIPGVSERIRVLSLLGRFLEHERVYAFGPQGAEEIWIGSADWMPRNLDRRVELMVPLQSEAARARVRSECMRPLETHVGAIYRLEASGTYRRIEREKEPEATRKSA
jgi:polyphosphate kinase